VHMSVRHATPAACSTWYVVCLLLDLFIAGSGAIACRSWRGVRRKSAYINLHFLALLHRFQISRDTVHIKHALDQESASISSLRAL
jgi:hypothetical protein